MNENVIDRVTVEITTIEPETEINGPLVKTEETAKVI